MMRLHAAGWRATTASGSLARWCWTWAWLCFLVHVAMAFHFYHRWSHADALERTRQVSGIGEGLYLSYLFTMFWSADVVFWWWSPARFAARSGWVDRLLHGFMLLMVFNSTVVFESGLIRWAGLAMFVGLGIAWYVARPLTTAQSV
jgi:hypothetical protein